MGEARHRYSTSMLLTILAGLGIVAFAMGSSAFLRYSAPMHTTLIIGHRGSPGHLPDHTLEGYTLAVEQGADYIEPDLVMTRDGVLIARHENELTHTTDVAQRFPDRQTTRTIDGVSHTGWFSEDFTLAEIKRLRAVQPLATRPQQHNGRYTVPTLDEILALRERLSAAHGRPIGVYPETKHPTYFRELGLPIEPALMTGLKHRGLDAPGAPVYLQSFELGNLLALDTPLPRILLVGDDDDHPMDDPRTYGQLLQDLESLARQYEGLGVHKSRVWTAEGPTDLVRRAHAVGLEVHVYTFRNEADQLGPAADDDPRLELRRFMELGVDAVFADFPDTAVEVRRALHGG